MNFTSLTLGVALVIALPAWSSAQRPGKPVIDREPVLEEGNPTAAPKASPAGAAKASPAAAASAGPPPEGQVEPGLCYLEYERADNGWAAHGRPDGDLGKEYIVLARGQWKAFVTNWANEKRRGSGTTFYGSHLRRATNQGTREIELRVRTSPATSQVETLRPGLPLSFRADLERVMCTQ